MNILWFVVGILVGAGGLALWNSKRTSLTALDWTLTVVWLVVALFAVAFVSTVLGEPGANVLRAAGVSALVLGGIAVVYGVLLGRRLLVKH